MIAAPAQTEQPVEPDPVISEEGSARPNMAIPDNDENNCLVQTLDVNMPLPNLDYVERVEARAVIIERG